MIRFVDRCEPVTTNHGYKPGLRQVARYGAPGGVGLRAGMVLTPLGEAYKTRLAFAAHAAHRRAGRPPPLERDVVVGVRFVFPTLGTDLDGPVKFVLDAIAKGTKRHPGAGVVVNDTRVRRLVVEKADPDGSPRTEVAVAQLGDAGGCPACGCMCGTLLPRSKEA